MTRHYQLASYLPLALAGILFAAPLAWLASNSLKTEDEVFGSAAIDLVPALPNPPQSGPSTDPATGEPKDFLLGPVRVLVGDGQEFEPRAGDLISHRVRVSGPAAVKLEDVVVLDVLRYSRVTYDFAHGASFDVVLTAHFPTDAGAFEAVQLEYQADDSWHLMDCEVNLPDGRRYLGARSVPLSGTRRGSIQWRIPAADEDVTRLRNWVELKPAAGRGPTGDFQFKLTVRQAGPVAAVWAKVRRNYDRVVDSIPIWQYARVSIVLAILNVFLAVASSAIVAYAFARLEWPGREVCFALLLGTILLPPQVTLVPRFLIWKSIGAHDTLIPLWLPSAFGSAFFIYLLREAIRAVPRELEDAARLDGCGTIGVFLHVMLPIVAPSLAAVATFTLIGSWNDFLGPLLFISDQRLYPLSFGVFALSAHSANDPALVSAAALALAAPIVILFFLLQRQVLRLSLAPAAKG